MADYSDDIARYLSGRMSAAEMHALEKRALDDPFLAEALEGGSALPEADFAEDVDQLQDLLAQRTQHRTTGAVPAANTAPAGKQISMWTWPTRIAAGFLIVASAGVIMYFINGEDRSADLALHQESAVSAEQKPSPVISADPRSHPDDGSVEQLAPAELSTANDEVAASEARKNFRQAPAAKPSQEEHAQALAGRAPGVSSSANADSVTLDEPGQRTEIASNDQHARAFKTGEAPRDALLKDEQADVQQPHAEVERTEAIIAQSTRTAAKKSQESRSEVPAAASSGAAKDSAAPSASGKNVFKGKVVDADGTAIPGVNVVIKGTNTGTVTDIHGDYQIALSDKNPTLVYTFIGYTNTEAVADASTPATVTLTEDLTQLSEVVVAGYGVQREGSPLEPTFDFAYPVGGKRAFKQYLEKNLQYPREALLNNVEGRVTIQFSVETSGLLSDFRVVKGIGSGCEEEVIRLIKSGPKWNPTKRDDIAEKSVIKVRMRFQLPKEKKKK